MTGWLHDVEETRTQAWDAFVERLFAGDEEAAGQWVAAQLPAPAITQADEALLASLGYGGAL